MKKRREKEGKIQMNLVKKIVSAIWGLYCLAMLLAFCREILVLGKGTGGDTIFLGVVFVLIPAIFLFRFIWKTRCPYCKKVFAIKKVGKKYVGSDDISVKVKTNNYNRKGEVIGTQEQYIPGKRNNYRIIYKCEKCGKEKYRMVTKDSANI